MSVGETTHVGSWASVDFLASRRKLPIIPCCYALYFDGELKYIGSTNNLRNRFAGHAIRFGYGKDLITPWADFPDSVRVTIKYRPAKKYGDWLMIEARLIYRIQPEFNTNLKRKLKGKKNGAS